MVEEIKNLYNVNVTTISNDFFKNHLADANAEYIRVYLYYLWKQKDTLSFSEIADDLNLTINDVERATKYWIKQKVLAKNSIIKDTDSEDENIENINDDNNVNINHSDSNEKRKTKILTLRNNNDNIDSAMNEVMLFAETMLPTVSSQQFELFKQLYTDLNMSTEVIEYLIEYCASQGKYTSSYMKKVAVSWYEQGLSNVDAVKEFIGKYNQLKNKSKANNKKNNTIKSKSRKEDYDNKFLEGLKG